jgi:hypothetical protein
MAGYTRQSIADIINGANITAPPLNAEFNKLQSAFHGTTGHAHTGSTGDGPQISLTTSISGFLPALNGGVNGRNNNTATTDPQATDDFSNGYSVGSLWLNTTTDRAHICTDSSTSAAQWSEIVLIPSTNVITPKITNTVDLGSGSLQFKDLYVDGIGNIDSIFADNIATTANATIGGTATINNLTTTGAVSIGSTISIIGGTINNTPIGATTPSTVTGTVITANTNFIGPLTGNVTGSITGNSAGTHTGPVSGDVTSTGTSNFNNVVIAGNLDMDVGSASTITNLTAPTNNNDAATKLYVDSSLANLVDSAPATLDTLNELAASLGDDSSFASTMTTALGTKLNLAGGTMSGAIDMGTQKITNLATPTAGSDSANKTYVDLKLPLAGGTLSGAISMTNNKITDLGTPTANTDATTKAYVDAILTNGNNAAVSAAAALVSETNSANSATEAQSWATQTGSPVGGIDFSAKHYANLAAAANTAVGNFFDTYFVSANEPTTSNVGDGDLWYDSTNSLLKVNTPGGFINVNSSVNGTSNRFEFIVGTNQNTAAGLYSGSSTTFPCIYDPGFLDVFKNGQRLVPSAFTASSGTSIVLASSASASDTISIISYGNFLSANHYSKTEADTLFGQKITDLEDEVVLELGII